MSVTPAPVSLSFGSFDYFCNQIGITLCPLVGNGREPSCYSRNIQIGGVLIFEPATLVIHVVALVMTTIMISHIKFKYTAVGRKEIVMFFYMYAATIIAEFITVSGIIPLSSSAYPYAAAVHTSLILATFWTLFMNAFVPFQFIEDGTALSLWLIRISTLIVFGGSLFIDIATFQNIAGFSSASPSAVWTLYFIFCSGFAFIYFVAQVFLVFTTLDDRWPLVDISVAAVFFVLAQILAFQFSSNLCEMAKHYLDGMFFSVILTLLAVMMVYKFWDTITKEDLEFAVGCKMNTWDIKDPLLSDSAMASMSHREDAGYGSRY
ncbi:Chitin synthase, class 7 [Terramyces sp. JEL0728]|nr:Chitin synthase, class 7 [Terramyces sp. JEL0728]